MSGEPRPFCRVPRAVLCADENARRGETRRQLAYDRGPVIGLRKDVLASRSRKRQWSTRVRNALRNACCCALAHDGGAVGVCECGGVGDAARTCLRGTWPQRKRRQKLDLARKHKAFVPTPTHTRRSFERERETSCTGAREGPFTVAAGAFIRSCKRPLGWHSDLPAIRCGPCPTTAAPREHEHPRQPAARRVSPEKGRGAPQLHKVQRSRVSRSPGRKFKVIRAAQPGRPLALHHAQVIRVSGRARERWRSRGLCTFWGGGLRLGN